MGIIYESPRRDEQETVVIYADAVTFWSEADDMSFFDRLRNIPCVREISGYDKRVTIKVVKRIKRESLRELAALFYRYHVDRRQLFAQFGTVQRAFVRQHGLFDFDSPGF